MPDSQPVPFAEYMLCALCHHVLVDPYNLLPCKHTFCGLCLLDHLAHRLKCPTCGYGVSAKLPSFAWPGHLAITASVVLPAKTPCSAPEMLILWVNAKLTAPQIILISYWRF